MGIKSMHSKYFTIVPYISKIFGRGVSKILPTISIENFENKLTRIFTRIQLVQKQACSDVRLTRIILSFVNRVTAVHY